MISAIIVEHIFLVYLSIKLSKRLIFISSRLIFICTKFTFSTCILYYTVTVTITMACHIICSNRQTDTNWISCVRLCSLVHYAGTCSCYSVYVTYAININSVADIRGPNTLLRLPLHLGLNKTLWNNLCIALWRIDYPEIGSSCHYIRDNLIAVLQWRTSEWMAMLIVS